MRCAAILFLVFAAAATGQEAAPLTVAWTAPLASPSFGSAAVADIDDDGRLEVAFGTYFGDDSVRVLNGEDGSEYWRFNAAEACVDASLRFVDLDGDGALELVVPVSNRGWVLAFDAKTGDEKWRYGTSPIECTDTPPAILDVDGDGKTEVVYGTFHGRLHVISTTGDKKRIYDVVKNFVQTGPAILDLDGDGILDYVCATFKGDNKVYAVNGKTGESLWTYQVPGKHMGMYHGPSVGDLDGDGKVELVIGAYDGKIHCLDGSTGKKRWIADPADRYFMSPTVIADLDGDGKPEVVSASSNVTVIDGKGKIRWSKPATKGVYDSITRGSSVADLDGDGSLDVATVSGEGRFTVFRGKDGKTLHDYDAGAALGKTFRASSHGVTIADLTGDGRLDCFFVLGATRPEKFGVAMCLTGFAGKGEGWYMLRHDPKNTGNLATTLDKVLLKRIEGLTPARKAVMKPSRAPKTGAVPARGGRPAKLPIAQVREMAAERKIPAAALEAVIVAHRPRRTPEALNAAAAHDADAFRAACLLIETGHASMYTDAIIERTWKPGREKALLELAGRKILPGYGTWSALRCLGHADTKEVRAWLLERLVVESDSGRFMSCARALGKLREPMATGIIARQILAFDARWSGVEVYLIHALAATGGKKAVPYLARYLRDERGKNLRDAIQELALIDREAARAEAKRILDSDRELKSKDKTLLEWILKGR